jgi:predicted enzyme related to lactoylglutathione lyase
MTTNYVTAFEFYKAVFGWEKVVEMDMGGGIMYLVFGKGGAQYGGIYNRTPDMGAMPPFWLVYIHVKDVSKAVETATKAGAVVHRPQMEIPGGTIAILGDPQGAGYAVHDTKSMAATATAAAAVAKAGTAVKSAVSSAVKAVKKAVRKAKKAPAVKKAKAKAKPVVRKAKAAARKVTSRVKARTTRKAAPKKAPRKPSPKKKARRTKAKSKK